MIDDPELKQKLVELNEAMAKLDAAIAAHIKTLPIGDKPINAWDHITPQMLAEPGQPFWSDVICEAPQPMLPEKPKLTLIQGGLRDDLDK